MKAHKIQTEQDSKQVEQREQGYLSNRVRLVASIAEREILRYSPAGIPIVSAQLQHESRQAEAGSERLINFEIAAVAAGEISGRFDSAALGEFFVFTGFLARKNRNSRSLIFHVTDFEPCQGNEADVKVDLTTI